ncbi:hypothetical protein SUNI508_11091 [Seiridium unicorne]|uniref:Uncharacterized protein n=1 Tax=Seiridium unicorne TaxID=138068 RepID=A0ABR2UIQ4_9PEZI
MRKDIRSSRSPSVGAPIHAGYSTADSASHHSSPEPNDGVAPEYAAEMQHTFDIAGQQPLDPSCTVHGLDVEDHHSAVLAWDDCTMHTINSFGPPWMQQVPPYPIPLGSQHSIPTPPFDCPPIQPYDYPLFPFAPRGSPPGDLDVKLDMDQEPTDPLADQTQANVNALIETNYQLSQVLVFLSSSHGDLASHERMILYHKKLERAFPLVVSLRQIITWFATSHLHSTTDLNSPCMLLIALSISVLSEICETVLRIFRGTLESEGAGQGNNDAYSTMLSDATLIEFHLAKLQKVLATLKGDIRHQQHDRLDGLRRSLLEFVQELRKGI